MLGFFIIVLFVVAVALLVLAMHDWERFIGTIMIGGVAFVVGALVIAGLCINVGKGGQGVSVGIVTNVSKQGYFFQPWGVWIVHQGEMKAEEFGVTQDDQPLLDRLQRDADAGRRVRVFYDSSVICGAWNQPNCDVIYKVDEE